MDLQDYLIDHFDMEWSLILREWDWLLPPVYQVWLLTQAGDLLITTPEGSIQMLEVGVGKLRDVAESREEFYRKIDDPNFANDLLMKPVVDALKASGASLSAGQCYSFRVLPIFGGDYLMGNRIALPIREHFGGWGSVHRQVAGLPDGSQVVIKASE
jgi:hypothetical protein